MIVQWIGWDQQGKWSSTVEDAKDMSQETEIIIRPTPDGAALVTVLCDGKSVFDGPVVVGSQRIVKAWGGPLLVEVE